MRERRVRVKFTNKTPRKIRLKLDLLAATVAPVFLFGFASHYRLRDLFLSWRKEIGERVAQPLLPQIFCNLISCSHTLYNFSLGVGYQLLNNVICFAV